MAHISLQINLTPADYRHSQYLLPHQLAVWAPQVDEVVLTYETHRSQGRFGGEWDASKAAMDALLHAQVDRYPTARIARVDYAPETMAAVAGFFFGRDEMPAKDFRGGPFYAYFFGLHAARYPLVLHLDADMFFGGQSASWVAEAVDVLRAQPHVLSVSPYPGPPPRDARSTGSAEQLDIAPEQKPVRVSASLTTRVFLLDRRALVRAGPLVLRRPSTLGVLKAWLTGNPPGAVPEDLITHRMQQEGWKRVQMLGTPPGMWSLHPKYRNERFYARLPVLIDRVNRGDMPAEQRGHYDMQDVLCDVSDARARDRWWRRGMRTLTAPLRRWFGPTR